MKKLLPILAIITLSFSYTQIASAAFITISGESSDEPMATEIANVSEMNTASSTMIHSVGPAREFTDTFTISVDEGVDVMSEYAFTFLSISSVKLFEDGVEFGNFDVADGRYSGTFLFKADTTYTVEVNAAINAERTATSSLSIEGTEAAISEVPVPAAVWLFGSAILGLTSFSRKNKAKLG